ncbi:hypothetical protein BDZ89DRAFT_959914 [Hymenopellis radicata]|nr:hypothetical protein BDZ89DRAFT_959914 [Hymenopellis radicata]
MQQPTSPTSPLAPFPPLPPPEFRSRAPEFYGFVAWTSTSLGFGFYLLWALLPDELIVSLGITWYPNRQVIHLISQTPIYLIVFREWAVLLPAYSVVLVLLAYLVYSALAIYGAPSFSEIRAVTDSRVHIPPTNVRAPLRDAYAPLARTDAVPELYDIPIGLANRVLYRDRRRQ